MKVLSTVIMQFGFVFFIVTLIMILLSLFSENLNTNDYIFSPIIGIIIMIIGKFMERKPIV